mmetsp:Transcript_25952/g.56887  ORF Transcript_25952/g.56887 Transcript_25952/m.56887 type:complete len:115 (+) Transcript_25952:627-971(+)|eukprot:CAMPEP_0168188614 /NCGR_PEP_ID=MMETSP0139_2-20121125/15788_1 /TAXON_ID=44445 /ORGANISM="Pseudo-nitzschia australis, Strain 10249 10 AB" /LENGTH=114 /DNA_ID=CAMNT_0008111157 /DNA_START=598 /DNA_END=942 /DNA_ORIENTATION=+
MLQQFGRLTANQKVWGAIGGVIFVGTGFKITYFQYCRDAMLKEGEKSHLDATEHYRKAREFAKWSAEDRAKKRADLPPLTPEQTEQMRNYLRMMQEYHAFNPDSDLDPVTGKPR